MTNKDAPHEFDPKHRIIGAIVVVALVVIFVPMLLSQRETATETVAPQPPPPTVTPGEENKVAITKVPPPAITAEPAKPAPAPEPAKPAVAPPVAAAPPSSSEPAKAATAQPKTPAPAPKTAASAKSSTVSSGWMVQVGTFSNTTNATRLEQKLRAEGQPVRSERIQLEGGNAVRLRVGPFKDRATAVKAQERILKDVGVKGVVLAYP